MSGTSAGDDEVGGVCKLDAIELVSLDSRRGGADAGGGPRVASHCGRGSLGGDLDRVVVG